MVQWRAQSILILVLVFLISLAVFNAAAYAMGPLVSSLPFLPNSRGYSVKLDNISAKILPLIVESYPLSPNTSYLSIWCGEEAEVNDYVISLKESYHVSIFSLCSAMTIEVWPRHENVGFWVKSQKPTHSFIIFFTKLIFIAIITYTFYVLFANNKNFSVMRSTLITQASCLLILDPISLLVTIIPGLSTIHDIISAAGWWRANSEIFAQYGPLVRSQTSFYKYIVAVPSVILFITTCFEQFCRFSFPNFMFRFGAIGGVIVPFLAVWFLFKARHSNGRLALTVHVLSGTLSMTICYYMRILHNCSEDFRESLVCQTLETSFVGAYALFQTIFQAGESHEETVRLLNQNVRRYDKIDELLDILGDIEENRCDEEQNNNDDDENEEQPSEK